MQWLRNLILVGLAVVGYLLILAWNKDFNTTPQTSSQTPASATVGATVATDLPAAPVTNSDVPVAPVAAPVVTATTPTSKQVIKIKTDVLQLSVDPVGGDIVGAALPAYTTTVTSQEPFALLENDAKRVFIAQSGLIGANGPDARPDGRPVYQATQTNYQLTGDKLEVPLVFTDTNGVEIHKVYTLYAGKYNVDIRYDIINRGTTPWHGVMYGQLKRDNTEDPSKSHQGMGMSTYLGGAWGQEKDHYNKLPFKEFTDEALNKTGNGGWVAMVQHYFVAAWIPNGKTVNHLTTRTSTDKQYHFIGFTTNDLVVPAGKQLSTTATLYTGPKVQDELAKLASGLELTVDYGWLWFIGQVLFWLLKHIHALVGNWGWAIVGLTVFVKAAFFKLSATSYKSMANMRRVAPEMQRIKEQFGNDRTKMSQAMMELYQREKINPVAGCLPLFIQMPVFLALYWVLMESVELRHAPWLLWIQDLAAMDPYFILPLLMGATMFGQQMLNPQPTDPMQAKVMKMMPIIFTVFMLWFPSGLVLYWVVNNSLSIVQQAIITRQIEAAGLKK